METATIVHRTDAIKLRNYGRILQDLVEYATTITDEKQRQAATIYIARCMRQKNQIWNKDFESGVQRLKEDIDTLSGGKLSTSFPEFDDAMTHTGSVLSEVQIKKDVRSKQQKKQKR
jgi:hypothetical protein